MEMNAHSLEEKGQNKTQCELCAIQLSHCCTESPALHTSNCPKLLGDKKKKKETPRDVLAYDEKVTGDFFDQEDHSVEDWDIYNTLGKKESKKEST